MEQENCGLCLAQAHQACMENVFSHQACVEGNRKILKELAELIDIAKMDRSPEVCLRRPIA